VTENGKGFKAVPEALGLDSGRQLGLALMEGRIRVMGGTLTITSEPKVGTRIDFTIPADEARTD
jgi:signal transduction histidine kinase